MNRQSRRERYLELLLWGERMIGDAGGLNLICAPPTGNAGRAPDFMAFVEWRLFQITKDRRHADAARRLIAGPRKHWVIDASYHRPATLMDEFCHYPFAVAYVGLRDAGLLSADEDRTAREFLQGSLRFWQEYPSFFSGATELDIGNLGITPGCGADYASRHVFEGAFARSLRAFADKIWNQYWAIGDCGEDATNYEPLHFVYMPLWARLRNRMKALNAYQANGSYERCLQQLLPVGVPVDQGDSAWMSGWDGWIASFEIAAHITRDGRYAWAAQRLLASLLSSGYRAATEAGVRRALDGEARFAACATGLPQSLFFLAVAVEWADATVAPEEPSGHASTVTYRFYPALPHAWDNCPLGGTSAGMTLFPHGRGERHEDKLILRSGYGPEANTLIASIDQKAYHDHDDSGAILAWVNRGDVLLHGSSYTQRFANAHNLLYVQPAAAPVAEALGVTGFHRGVAYSDNRGAIEFIEDLSVAVLARYRSVHLYGFDTTWRRTLVFPRDGAFLAVLDEIENRGPDLWAAPLWHFQNVHAAGDSWADADQGELWTFPNLTWSRQTRRVLVSAPLGRLQRIRQDNPDLEPRAAQSREDRLRAWGQQECLYQHGAAAMGGHNWFLTLLVPHAPQTSAAAAAGRIRVLARETAPELPAGSPPSWCLEITDEAGARHVVGMAAPRLPVFYNVPRPDHLGYLPSWAKKVDVGDPHADRATWFAVKDGDRPVLVTDAELFYVKPSAARTDVAVRHMRNLEINGLRHHAGISPAWPPTRFQINGEFTLEEGRGRAAYSCRNFSPIELSFGFKPKRLKAKGGVNGIRTAARAKGDTIAVELNGVAEIAAER